MPRCGWRSSTCSRTLRDELKVSIIYITHDLATAYYISDRIIIMQKGEVVESGDARAVLDNPQHPYSILLKNSVLSPDVPATTSGDDEPQTVERTAPSAPTKNSLLPGDFPMLKAEVLIDRDFAIGDTDPRLFGAFVEHLGRCVYGGIFEPGHPRLTSAVSAAT